MKELLTGTYQKECNGIPVNNKVYNEQLNRFSGKEGVMNFTSITAGTARTIKSTSLPGKLVERARELVSSVKQCELADEAVFDMIRDEVSRYMEGRVTAEQAARNLNDKVNLYLNE